MRRLWLNMSSEEFKSTQNNTTSEAQSGERLYSNGGSPGSGGRLTGRERAFGLGRKHGENP